MRNGVQLIAYADRFGGGGLSTVRDLLTGPLDGVFTGVHLLPFYTPYDGADAGFDPVDHTSVDPRLGNWSDVAALAATHDVTADLIGCSQQIHSGVVVMPGDVVREDIELCDMIMHLGHNARESHPIIFWRIADHKKKTNIPTVVVDPRMTGTSKGYEDINPKNQVHVPILNGDISFLNALAHVLLKEHDDVIDWEFVKAHATGWEKYVDGVLKDYSPEQVQDRMGSDEVTPEMIRRVAGMFADATRKRLSRGKDGSGGVIIMWGIGYNQHIHGQHNVISIINLLTLTGNLAKPGCGPFSMTGQPNAMGERFTGGLTGRLPFNKPLKDAPHRKWMAKQWRVPEKNLIKAMNSKNPGFAIGMMERALKGGLDAIAAVNLRKAEKLYAAIDSSGFYSNPVAPHCRSIMNVPFVLADPDLDGAFLEQADALGLKNLKGHRSVGGIRASIYNAMPEEGVDALISFMQDFEKANG